MGMYKEGFYYVFKVEERVTIDKVENEELHEVCVYPKPLKVWRDSDGRYWHKKELIEVSDNANDIVCSYRTKIGAPVFKGFSFATPEYWYQRHFMKYQEELLRIFKGYGKEPIVLPTDSDNGKRIIKHIGGSLPMVRSKGGKVR